MRFPSTSIERRSNSRKSSNTHWPTKCVGPARRFAPISLGFAKQTHSRPEFARFISMALGSCSEVETWISYAFDLGYITRAQRDEWFQAYVHIYGMLVNLRERLK